MEFYSIISLYSSSFACFNSQRDGILLRSSRQKTCLNVVSIPNGMEFYYILEIYNVEEKVSIPNGMEFYL